MRGPGATGGRQDRRPLGSRRNLHSKHCIIQHLRTSSRRRPHRRLAPAHACLQSPGPDARKDSDDLCRRPDEQRSSSWITATVSPRCPVHTPAVGDGRNPVPHPDMRCLVTICGIGAGPRRSRAQRLAALPTSGDAAGCWLPALSWRVARPAARLRACKTTERRAVTIAARVAPPRRRPERGRPSRPGRPR